LGNDLLADVKAFAEYVPAQLEADEIFT